jgi:hypothetical protein
MASTETPDLDEGEQLASAFSSLLLRQGLRPRPTVSTSVDLDLPRFPTTERAVGKPQAETRVARGREVPCRYVVTLPERFQTRGDPIAAVGVAFARTAVDVR